MKTVSAGSSLGYPWSIAHGRTLWLALSHALVASIVSSCVSTPAAYENGGYPYDYYCPESDVTLAANERDMRLFGHAYVRFPQSVTEAGNATTGWFGASFTDCSTAEFACLEVKGAKTAHLFYLIVPRQLEAKKEYTLHGARMVTTFATAPRMEAIQVTLWQPQSDSIPPMKLTIEKSRGVVFWSGISFWDDARSNSGETCVLQSRTGIFNQVDVLLPQTRESVAD